MQTIACHPALAHATSHSVGTGVQLLRFFLLRGNNLLFYDFDNSYLERLREGDFRTQEHFVGYFSELIQLKLRSRLRSPQAIEDVRQETFARVLVALRSSGGIREPQRLGAYVNPICNNVLLEHYRSSSRQSSLEEEDSQEFVDPTVDALSALVTHQTRANVRQVVDELPEKDRRILKEVFLEDVTKTRSAVISGWTGTICECCCTARLSFMSLYLKRAMAPGGWPDGK